MVIFLSAEINENVISPYCLMHISKELRQKSKLLQSYLRLVEVFFPPDCEYGSIEKLRLYRLTFRESAHVPDPASSMIAKPIKIQKVPVSIRYMKPVLHLLSRLYMLKII